MRVFISSVRQGLEQERDALPGLLKAIGHEPVRFEDFTAQQVPSRQACMDGIDGADAYLLLLGPKYGRVFPETGQSATHDEYVRARTRGIPRLVFHKDGVDMDDDQAAFIDAIGDYGSGSFWDSFTDVTDLQTKVAAALRELAVQPGHLVYERLTDPVAVTWRSDWDDPRYRQQEFTPVAELHVVPLAPARIPARVMRASVDRLVGALRTSGAVPAHTGLEPQHDDESAIVEVPAPERNRGHNAVQPSNVRGVRIDNTGQVSVWWTLPSDGMGGILNDVEFAQSCARALRLAGAVGVGNDGRHAVAVGLTGTWVSVVEGALPQSGRNQASMGVRGDEPVRVLPDESVSATAFDRGADEYGRDLAGAMLESFRS